MAERMFDLGPTQAKIKDFIMPFKEFPKGKKVGSFSLDQVLEQIQSSQKNRGITINRFMVI